MSDWFYTLVRVVGTPAFWVSASPIVLHPERARRDGAFIVAATHFSPYDVAILVKDTPRHLDFVSIVEVFVKRWLIWFFTNMNAIPVDRSKVDTAATRRILDRLLKGRAVAMFPEGRIVNEAQSVLNGGKIRPGVFGFARAANCPVIPCVILGTGAYSNPKSWAPLRKTVYAITYGEPLFPDESWDDVPTAEKILRDAYAKLHAELLAALGDRKFV